MKFKIVGQKPNPIFRATTGWYTFDKAFTNPANSIGFPMRGLVELFGSTGCGKTTFALSLASKLGNLTTSDIAFADIEYFDPDHTLRILEQSGFEENFHFVSEKTDEQALNELVTLIREKNVSVGIFDSIGAVSPQMEQAGELGEANMGRRAFLMAQFSRRLTHLMASKPDTSMIMVNHQYPIIGGKGMLTPGGKSVEYLSPIRIHVKKGEEFSDGSYTMIGTVKKNRYGFEDLIFTVFILAGAGVNDLMTSVVECKYLKLLKGNWRSIQLNDVSFGNYSSILEKAVANDMEFFQPFYDELNKLEVITGDIDETETNNNDTSSD